MTFILGAVLYLWALAIAPHAGRADKWWHLLAFAAVLFLMDMAINVSRLARKVCDDKRTKRVAS